MNEDKYKECYEKLSVLTEENDYEYDVWAFVFAYALKYLSSKADDKEEFINDITEFLRDEE